MEGDASDHHGCRGDCDVKPTARQKGVRLACVLFNVLCGATNGYDICVTSVLLNAIVHDFSLCSGSVASSLGTQSSSDVGVMVTSCASKQAVMSISALGSFFAKLSLTWLADRYGRRVALAIVDVLIIVAVVAQFATSSAAVFFVGRFVLGMAMGLAFVVGPTYICEIAPPDQRGRYVVINEVAVCVGCLIGLQVASSLLNDWETDMVAWRLAVALGALPAVLQLAFVFLLPESPRWLAMHGHCKGLERAALALGLTGSELTGLRNTAKAAKVAKVLPDSRGASCRCSISALRCFWKTQHDAYDKHGLAFLLSLCVAFFTTASGIFAMQSYAYDILFMSGVGEPSKLLPLVGWMKLAGALIAMVLADIPLAGRRRLALCGGLLCCACHTVLATRLALPSSVSVKVAVIAFFGFIFSWNAGYGGIQFAATLEMLPNEVRSLWGGQIFAIVGIVEILIYQLFEFCFFENGVVTFACFGAINFFSAVFAACVLPDLGGQSLEKGADDLAFEDPDFSPKASSAEILTPETVKCNAASKKTATRRVPRGSQEGSAGGVGRKTRRYGKLVEETVDPSAAVGEEPRIPEPLVIGRSDGI